MKPGWQREEEEEEEIILQFSQSGRQSAVAGDPSARRLKGPAAIFLFECHIRAGFSSSLLFAWTPNWRFRLEASPSLLTGVGLIDGFESVNLEEMAAACGPASAREGR